MDKRDGNENDAVRDSSERDDGEKCQISVVEILFKWLVCLRLPIFS